jgi:hypothetical protein
LIDHDVALIRIHDGGYYLIGIRGFHEVLPGVPMSTTSEAVAVVVKSMVLRPGIAELPETFDVDVAANLDLLRTTLVADIHVAPTTRPALAALGLWRQSVQIPSAWSAVRVDQSAGSSGVRATSAHRDNTSQPTWPAITDARRMPSLASVISSSSLADPNARSATKSDVVNPIPASYPTP